MADQADTAQAPAHAPGAHPDLPPPATTVGVVGWLRQSLFSSPLNTALTLLAIYLLYVLIPPAISWAIIDADWVGETREACSREGACWVFIIVWFKQILYGRYPDVELWRINLGFVILAFGVALLLMPRFRWKAWVGVFLIFIYPLIALYLFAGMSIENVRAWPYRLMALSALVLAGVAMLPNMGIWLQHARNLSIAVIVITVLWGLASPSTWTLGILYGTSTGFTILTVLLAVVPGLALAAGMLTSQWRGVIADKFWVLSMAATVLALIGFALPLMFWDETAGASPPWVIAFMPAMLALAALSPWGYGEQAGTPGLVARLLLPFYLLVVYLVLAGPPDFLNIGAFDWSANTMPFFNGVRGVVPDIETPLWGGLYLTLVIGIVGIVGSMPIGIVLALGRRSDMPIVHSLCIAFIELWRGVPLITVLFMASVMFPLFLPEGLNFDKLVRALIGVMLFSAAYMAEVVRGGLQAIPKGQYEAAEAMGLSYWKSMSLIILPQALKLVIPGIVNTFIGLFKDTTLVLIIGLFDLLGMVQLAGTNPKWLGFATEGYVFAALGFWVFCFSMSRYSQHLERKLHTGH